MSDLQTLVRLAELDPSRDFRFGDWSGLDAADANLRGYDFTGAVIDGANFCGASIGPGLDANGAPSPGACFDGAIIRRIDRRPTGEKPQLTPVANIHEAADYKQYIASWQRGPELRGYREAFQVGDVFRDAPFAPDVVVVPCGTVRPTQFYADPLEILREIAGGSAASTAAQSGQSTDVGKFAVAARPISVAQWMRFARETGRATDMAGEGEADEQPINNVTWHDAQAFAEWLTELCGKPYRLLTEAEVDHCLSAGGDYVRYTTKPHPVELASTLGIGLVTETEHNDWGLYGMRRYSLEWCSDVLSKQPGESARTDETRRVCRGALPDLMDRMQLAFREGVDEAVASTFIGFRVARDLT